MSKSIIITGAEKGIGLALTKTCVKKGWYVVAIDRDISTLQKLSQHYSNLMPLQGSVDGQNISNTILQLKRLGTTFDYLVNNAAIDVKKSWSDIQSTDLDATFSNNVSGPFELTKWWADSLVSQNKTGAAIFITSLHDQKVRFHIDYSLSKAATTQLIKEAAAELSQYKIRINGVRPGAINTWDPEGNDPRTAAASKLVPLGGLGKPEDLIEACLFLLDEQKSGYMTGQQITIDGGLELYNWLFELGVD